MAHKVSRFGWLPDLPDQRDIPYIPSSSILKKLPSKIDLRDKMPPVMDQGTLGSCTAHVMAAVYQFDLTRQKAREIVPSRLFIYYNQRATFQSTQSDSGAGFRNGLKSLCKQGVCPENMWPYEPHRFADRPANSCFTEAQRHLAITYHRLPRKLTAFKACLAENRPFTCGFVAYETFESESVASTGKLGMPKKGEALVGGHAAVIVGYEEKTKRFLARNSWGKDWGTQGYFTLPYEYLLNEQLSNDFWVMSVLPARQLKQLMNGQPDPSTMNRPLVVDKNANRLTESHFRVAY
ncbi:MAG: C1 family peptidase [Cyclobacteriaceae bacterium]